MRIQGTLKKWNDERGFGFIQPTHGGQEVFVHISSFPRDGRRPVVDEVLTFEVTLARDGKKQAVKLARPGSAHAASARPRPAAWPHAAPRRGFVGRAVVLAVLVALSFYGYKHWPGSSLSAADASASKAALVGDPAAPSPNVIAFRCDGRTHCSQMTSCAEATFFLKNCPGVKMDGDHDGVPCEEQWCTSLSAK